MMHASARNGAIPDCTIINPMVSKGQQGGKASDEGNPFPLPASRAPLKTLSFARDGSRPLQRWHHLPSSP